MRNRNTPRAVAATAFSGVSAAGDTPGTGNFLSSGGGPVNGQFALSPPVDFSIEIDADGIIDIGESSSNSQYTSNIQLEDIQPNTFTLDTIAGAAFDGALLFIRTFRPTIPITIAQATFLNGGNIQTPDDTDVTVGNLQTILLIFDADLVVFDNAPGGTWRLLNTFGTGGGGVSFPENFPGLDMGSPTVSADIDYADANRHFRAIELSDDLIINLLNVSPSTDGKLGTIYFKQDGIGGHVPSIPLLDNPEELENIGTDPNETTVFTVQVFNGLILGFTSGKSIFFGSSVSDWANFQAVNDVNFATFDGINIDRFVFNQAVGSSLSASDTGITSFSDGRMDFNIPTGAAYNLAINGVASMIITNSLITAQTIIPSGTDDLGLVSLRWNNVFGNTGNFNDVTMNTGSISEVALTQYVDTASVARGSISGDASLGLVLSTALSGKFSIQDVITPIATFDNTTGLKMEGTHGINMNKNTINTIGQIQLDRTVAFSPTIETGISFDNTLSALNYNVGFTSDVHAFRAAGELLASISRIGSNEGQLSIEAVVANILQANEMLFLASFTNTVPSNGDVWRDSGDGEFKFRQNGITEGLGGEFFGPWTATHDAGGQLLDNFGNINSDNANLPASGKIKLGNNELIGWVKTDNVSIVEFGLSPADLLSITGGDLSLVGNDIVDVNLLEGRLSNPLNINVPTSGQILNFQFQGVTEWLLSSDTLTGDNLLLNNTLTIVDSSTSPVADGIFSRNGNVLGLQIPTFQLQRNTTGTNFGELGLVKIDGSPSDGEPIYKINFSVDDFPGIMVYSQISGEIKEADNAGILDLNVRANGISNVNALTIEGSTTTTNRTFVSLNTDSRIGSDLKFEAPTGSASLKIFPALQHLGIVVQDNASFTVGTLGTLTPPLSTANNNPPTIAELDGLFGDHIGAEGTYGAGTALSIYRKINTGDWARFAVTSFITV